MTTLFRNDGRRSRNQTWNDQSRIIERLSRGLVDNSIMCNSIRQVFNLGLAIQMVQSEHWKPELVLYVTTYKYVRRHNKVKFPSQKSFLDYKFSFKIHEFLTLIWPLLLSMTSWHGLYTLPLYLFVIIYSRFQWVALGWFSKYLMIGDG